MCGRIRQQLGAGPQRETVHEGRCDRLAEEPLHDTPGVDARHQRDSAGLLDRGHSLPCRLDDLAADHEVVIEMLRPRRRGGQRLGKIHGEVYVGCRSGDAL